MDEIIYYVSSGEETHTRNGGAPTSYVPTLGAQTTVVDQYRIVGVHHSELEAQDASFTDVYAASSLAKLAEGGISDVRELEATELALQSLLLHEKTHVLTWAPKVDFGNGLITYVRLDQSFRTQFAFDLFNEVGRSRDFLVAPEFLVSDGEKIVESSQKQSLFMGMRNTDLHTVRQYDGSATIDAVNAAIDGLRIPAYLTDTALVHSRRGEGFQKKFYHRLRVSWDKATEGMPTLDYSFNIPPMLAIVLNRLNNRADLKKCLVELREELAPVRAELRDFNRFIRSTNSQQEVVQRVRRLEASFDAIVPESMVSAAGRRKRNLSKVFRLGWSLLRTMPGYVLSTGVSMRDIESGANGMQSALFSDVAVDNTVTATTFAGLLRVESLQSLVPQLLSDSEIAQIERSIRRHSK